MTNHLHKPGPNVSDSYRPAHDWAEQVAVETRPAGTHVLTQCSCGIKLVAETQKKLGKNGETVDNGVRVVRIFPVERGHNLRHCPNTGRSST